MRKFLWFTCCFVMSFMFVFSAHAQPNPDSGEALYTDYCAECHGENGEGKKGKWPWSHYEYNPVVKRERQELLDYLKKYHDMFHSGESMLKSEAKMAKVAGRLSPEEMVVITEYVMELKAKQKPQPVEN